MSKKEIIKKALKSKFRPEFLNRLDDIIVFNSLEKEDIEKVIAGETKIKGVGPKAIEALKAAF